MPTITVTNDRVDLLQRLVKQEIRTTARRIYEGKDEENVGKHTTHLLELNGLLDDLTPDA